MHATARQLAASYCLEAPDGFLVTFRAPVRSTIQNAKMWAALSELSEYVKWDGETLSPAEWKDLLSACLRKQKVVRGVEGGLVFLGARTSQMTAAEMSDLIELIHAFGAEKGVVFTDQRSSTRTAGGSAERPA